MHTLILGINRSENEDVYNSLVVIDKDTNILSKYDKNKISFYAVTTSGVKRFLSYHLAFFYMPSFYQLS